MTRFIFLTSLALMLGLTLTAAAQDGDAVGQGHGICQFIDEDGDGFNDLAPDADGDGIPNGLDPDYEQPEDCDGDGQAHQGETEHGRMARNGQAADGETLLATAGADVELSGDGQGHAYGLNDGSGGGLAPGDGTGFGPGDGTNECDGTGTPADAVQQRRGGRR